MSKIKLKAGNALNNGVVFSTDNYYAIARYPEYSALEKVRAQRNGVELKSNLEVVSGEVEPSVADHLGKIPIIGGLVLFLLGFFLKNDKEPWKTIKGEHSFAKRFVGFLITAGAVALFSVVSYLIGSWLASLFGIPEGTFLYGIMLSLIIPCISFLGILVATRSPDELFNFHGAEHKVGNAFRKSLELSKENVAAQSIYHPNCSTNLIVNASIIYPFIMATIYAWSNSFILAVILSPIAGAVVNIEMLRISIWLENSFINYILNFFGLLTQRLTVSEPEEKHIDAALAAMNRVLELEYARET